MPHVPFFVISMIRLLAVQKKPIPRHTVVRSTWKTCENQKKMLNINHTFRRVIRGLSVSTVKKVFNNTKY